MRFRVWTPRAWQDGHEVVTDPIALDVSRWQAPLPLTAAALDGALAAGHGLRVVFSETAMPGGGSRSLDVREDGLLLGLGYGDLGGGQHTSFRRGTLDGARRAALLESLRTAPLADFSADPKYRAWEDGHPVRLLVVAGPVAFVGGSQEEDFVDSGLGPLLDHLRGLFLSLPVVRSEE